MIRLKKHQADMQSLERQLQAGAMRVTLSDSERQLMREQLAEYVAYKPIRGLKPKRTVPALHFPGFFRMHHVTGALVIALVVTTSTVSVSSAAADALPGDLLYPVKVHLNEGVKTVFISGDEASIAWERERAEKRLEEASTLAAQGRLDEARQQVVAKQLAVHTDAVVEKVRAVEQTDPVLAAEASAEFADTMDTHKAVLARMVVEEDEGDVQESARGLVEEVHRVAHEAQLLRNETEEKLDLSDDELVSNAAEQPAESEATAGTEAVSQDPAVQAPVDPAVRATKERAAARARDRAMELQNEAETLVDARDENDPLKATAEVHLKAASARITEGDALVTDGKFGRAYTSYRDAATALHKVTALLQVADAFTPQVSAGMLDEDLGDEEEEPAAEPALTEDVQTETDTDTEPVLEDDTAAEESTDAAAASSEESYAHTVDALHGRAQAELDALKKELGMPGDDADAGVYTDARRLTRDMAASILRADSARAIGDTDEAIDLYTTALRQAEHTRTLLAGPADGVVDERAGGSGEAATSADQDAADQSATSTPEPIVFVHSFSDPVHTYVGDVPVTDCATTVQASLSVVEVPQTELSLMLTTQPDPEGTCADTAHTVEVTASTTASPQAQLTAVTLNGEQIPYRVVELKEKETSARDWWQQAIGATETFLRHE